MSTYTWLGEPADQAFPYLGRYNIASDWQNDSAGRPGDGYPKPGDSAIVNGVSVSGISFTGAFLTFPLGGYPEIDLFPQQNSLTLLNDPEALHGWNIKDQNITLNAAKGAIALWSEDSRLTSDHLTITAGTVALENYLNDEVSGNLVVGASGTAFLFTELYDFDTSDVGPENTPSTTKFDADISVLNGSTFAIESYPQGSSPADSINDGQITIAAGGTFVADDQDDRQGLPVEFGTDHTGLFENNGTLLIDGAGGSTTAARLDIDVDGHGTIALNGNGAAPDATTLLVLGNVTNQVFDVRDATVQVDDARAAIETPGTDTPDFSISGGAFSFQGEGVLNLHQAPLTAMEFVTLGNGNLGLAQEPDGYQPFTTKIHGFDNTDTINLQGVDVGGTYKDLFDPKTHVLEIYSPSSTQGNPPEIFAELTLSGSYNPDLFHLSGNSSTQVLAITYTGDK